MLPPCPRPPVSGEICRVSGSETQPSGAYPDLQPPLWPVSAAAHGAALSGAWWTQRWPGLSQAGREGRPLGTGAVSTARGLFVKASSVVKIGPGGWGLNGVDPGCVTWGKLPHLQMEPAMEAFQRPVGGLNIAYFLYIKYT